MAPKTKSTPAAAASASSAKSKKDAAHKSTPKKPLLPAERLRRLFASLCAQVDGGHFNNAVKTCEKILRLAPDDADALQTKLFLLLQTEQYGAALELIDALEKPSQYAFERAYSMYRLQREVEAREVLQAIKEESDDADRGVLHLEAQLNYREGLYQAAYDLYSQLLDTAEPGSEEHSDLLTNLQAAQQHLDFINTGFLRALDALPAALSAGIESAPPPAPLVTAGAAVLATASPAVRTDAKPTEKKVRASRVPKGVVPGVTPPPDPERWLKKSERSTFGQGRKRRGGGGGGGATQGSVESAAPVSAAGHAGKGAAKGKKKK